MGNEDRDGQVLYEMMPHVATQIRLALAGVYVAASRLAPAEKRAKDPELDKNAAMLLQGYFRLLRLTNELDAAPLLAGRGPLPTQNTELVEWTQALILEAQPLFELRGVTLRMQCALRSHVVAVHRAHLRRSLWQLLGNALKYTETGGTVTVTLQCQHQQVLLQVSDTGCGIPAEQIEDVFRLYALPQRIDQNPHGLGLGLPLARQVAERHGGQLLLDSKVGQGHLRNAGPAGPPDGRGAGRAPGGLRRRLPAGAAGAGGTGCRSTPSNRSIWTIDSMYPTGRNIRRTLP